MDREDLELILKLEALKDNPNIYQILEDAVELTICDNIRELDELFHRITENARLAFLDRVTYVVDKRRHNILSTARDSSIRIQGGS